jgi:hypothetical protein
MPILRARNFQVSQRNYHSIKVACKSSLSRFRGSAWPLPRIHLPSLILNSVVTGSSKDARTTTARLDAERPYKPSLEINYFQEFLVRGNDNTSVISWQVGRHARTARGYARNHRKSSTSLDYRGPSPRAPETNQAPGPRVQRKA